MKDNFNDKDNFGNEIFHALVQELLGMGIDNHVRMDNGIPKNPRDDIINPNKDRINRGCNNPIENIDLYEENRRNRQLVYDQLNYILPRTNYPINTNPIDRNYYPKLDPETNLNDLPSTNYLINTNPSIERNYYPKSDSETSLKDEPTSLYDIFMNRDSPFSILNQIGQASSQIFIETHPEFKLSTLSDPNSIFSWFNRGLGVFNTTSDPNLTTSSSWTSTSYYRVVKPDGSIEEKKVIKSSDGTQHIEEKTTAVENSFKDSIENSSIKEVNLLNKDTKQNWFDWTNTRLHDTYQGIYDKFFNR